MRNSFFVPYESYLGFKGTLENCELCFALPKNDLIRQVSFFSVPKSCCDIKRNLDFEIFTDMLTCRPGEVLCVSFADGYEHKEVEAEKIAELIKTFSVKNFKTARKTIMRKSRDIDYVLFKASSITADGEKYITLTSPEWKGRAHDFVFSKSDLKFDKDMFKAPVSNRLPFFGHSKREICDMFEVKI